MELVSLNPMGLISAGCLSCFPGSLAGRANEKAIAGRANQKEIWFPTRFSVFPARLSDCRKTVSRGQTTLAYSKFSSAHSSVVFKCGFRHKWDKVKIGMCKLSVAALNSSDRRPLHLPKCLQVTSAHLSSQDSETAVVDVGDTANACDGEAEDGTCPDFPVEICETRRVGHALSLSAAMAALAEGLQRVKDRPPPHASGVLRLTVSVPPTLCALSWLRSQPEDPALLPRVYLSPRAPRGTGLGSPDISCQPGSSGSGIDGTGVGAVAGVGASMIFRGDSRFSLHDWKRIRRYLSEGSPYVRAYGGTRFNSETEASEEWKHFGAFFFTIPQIELRECGSCALLACTLVWDNMRGISLDGAMATAELALTKVSSMTASQQPKLGVEVRAKRHVPEEKEWNEAVAKTLAEIGDGAEMQEVSWMQNVQWDASALDNMPLIKVVMARRTMLETSESVDPLALLTCLQERDPSAYQFCIQLTSGHAFVGSTPERLFVRKGLAVSSEAVAATRPRGSVGDEDFDIGVDLLTSKKDHEEFGIVREIVRSNMQTLCKVVDVEESKRLIKQARIQHLYSRINGELFDEEGEFQLLDTLHQTPAVCGHPRSAAMDSISASEDFDRGWYAGPIGWFGGSGAEFAVAIRSALIPPESALPGGSNALLLKDSAAMERSTEVLNGTPGWTLQPDKARGLYLFAGVGIVQGAQAASEWRELNLKISQFEVLLAGVPPLDQAENINTLWARLLVEECCRLGVTYFCVAPGSRSSPLAFAAATHPRAHCVTCIDERSLAFHALGFGRGARSPAAVITSSGTAVSNLFPAVVEASQDCIPLLLLTADRPPELRDTGANQTIDQVKHFSSYVRYHIDLPPPDDNMPARMLLTTIDAAVHRARAHPSGPVHINVPFREPLAPITKPWREGALAGMQRWVTSAAPFTSHAGGADSTALVVAADIEAAISLIRSTKRGLLVIGGLHSSEETWAAAQLARHLGWPVFADVASGLRVHSKSKSKDLTSDTESYGDVAIAHFLDHVLLSEAARSAVTPDVVLQVGGRVTSKRVATLLDNSPLHAYILVEEHPFRFDASHVLSHRLQMTVHSLLSSVTAQVSPEINTSQKKFRDIVLALSEAVGREISSKLEEEPGLKEPTIARLVASAIPEGGALFLGNSMPIRDVDMYSIDPNALPPPTMPVCTSPGPKVPAKNVSVPTPNEPFAGMSQSALQEMLQTIDMMLEGASVDILSESLASGEAANANSRRSGAAGLLDLPGMEGMGPKIPGLLNLPNSWAERLEGPSSEFAKLWGQGGSEATDEGQVAEEDRSGESAAEGVGVRVAANRGASGIDGVLSTAVGFAAGAKRQVGLLVGDVSFLHDTNGLMLLTQRPRQPQVVTVVVNNKGGGIFSLLPIADAVPKSTFRTFWSTPHDVDLELLCQAHRVPHSAVKTKAELRDALRMAWQSGRHWVIEASTNIDNNVQFHRELQVAAQLAATRAAGLLCPPPPSSEEETVADSTYNIQKAEYLCYRMPLSAPPTSVDQSKATSDATVREGLLLCITLTGGACGVGEVAPLPGLHVEDVRDAEVQLRLVISKLHGVHVPPTLPLLTGTFHKWIKLELGLQDPDALYPSVRSGLEMAVLNALAHAKGTSPSQLFRGLTTHQAASPKPGTPEDGNHVGEVISEGKVRICGLLDSVGGPEEMAREAAALVRKGYDTLKIKVGRRAFPLEDALAVWAVRNAVGAHTRLRADANRKWTLLEAVEFGRQVAACNLEYVEEPVENPRDLVQFFRETGVAFALDETVDEGLVGAPNNTGVPPQLSASQGLGAVVVKPGRIGGLEKAAAVARWTRRAGVPCIVSAAFESSVALSAYVQLAHFLDSEALASGGEPPVAHGLGTYEWLGGPAELSGNMTPVHAREHSHGDAEAQSLAVRVGDPAKESDREAELKDLGSRLGLFETEAGELGVSANVEVTAGGVREFGIDMGRLLQRRGRGRVAEEDVAGGSERKEGHDEERRRGRKVEVETGCAVYSFLVREDGVAEEGLPTLVLLHGFLGSSRDWLPIMDALSPFLPSIAIDLPGHGETSVLPSTRGEGTDPIAMENVAEALASLMRTLGHGPFVVAGYSLGARIALYLALRHSHTVAGAVVISGSPGLRDNAQRIARAARDDELANSLRAGGIPAFVDSWYNLPMWKSLRRMKGFETMKAERASSADAEGLAGALSSLSTGRQPSLWAELATTPAPLLLVAGAEDTKFVRIARCMRDALCTHNGAMHGGASPTQPTENDTTRALLSQLSITQEEVVRKLDTETEIKMRMEGSDAASSDWRAEGGNGGLREDKERPPVEVLEVPSCGHAAHLERPDILLPSLLKFALRFQPSGNHNL